MEDKDGKTLDIRLWFDGLLTKRDLLKNRTNIMWVIPLGWVGLVCWCRRERGREEDREIEQRTFNDD